MLETDEGRLGMLKLDMEMQGLSVKIDWFWMLEQAEVLNNTWHSHSGLEMHFMTAGNNLIEADGGVWALGPGEALLLPRGMPHRLSNPGGQAFMRYVLSVDLYAGDCADGERYLCESLNIAHPVRLDIPDKVLDMLGQCQSEAEAKRAGYVSVIELTVMRILFELARALTGYPKAESGDEVRKTAVSSAAGRIKALIERGAQRGITVREVSETMHLSAKHVQRLVRQEYGCTVKELIVRTRLKVIKDYLKNTQMSVSEIAETLGFSSEQSFCRFFRSAEGQSPSQYRKGVLGLR